MANIKETLIATMQNGKEVLTNISISRQNGADIVLQCGKVEDTIRKLHPKTLHLVVTEIIPRTAGSKSFRLASTNGYLPPFQAGQYINIVVEIDGVRTTRPYSISSSPKQKSYYEITIAGISNGFVSDYFLQNVKVGDTFEANSPTGVFHYNPVFHSKNMVLLAGGSGITPFVSMIKEVLQCGLERNIKLIYGARDVENAMFDDELKALSKNHANFEYTLVLSNENATGGDRTGFLDEACIKEIVSDLTDKTFYVCGPLVMTDFCIQALSNLRVKDKDVRREMFGVSAEITKEPGYPQNISTDSVFHIKIGDITIPAKASESLLQAIERAGVRINVCCRSGECSLCRVKLVNGKVFMPHGVLLRYADEKFGYIHSCKAYPIEDIEIIL